MALELATLSASRLSSSELPASLNLLPDLIGAARKIDDAIPAFRVGDGCELRDLKRLAGDGHRDARQRAPCLVGDRAVDAGRADVLSRGGQGKRQRQQQT